ncbi:MAG: ABC transporter permease subunit [Candidatus Promineifilaceae bacterium]
MTAEAVKAQPRSTTASGRGGIFSGRSGRVLRENLTAYLFLLPALLIVFIYGIFPILFAGYVSLYKWRIRQGEYRGIENYVTAMGDLAYVFFFVIALALIYVGASTAWKAVKDGRSSNVAPMFPLISLIPGGILAYGISQIMLRFITYFAQERAIDAGEAEVLGSVSNGFLFIVVGVVVNNLVNRWQRQTTVTKSKYAVLPNFGLASLTTMLSIGLGVMMGFFTWRELQSAENVIEAIPRIQSTFLGIVILIVGYFLWSWGSQQTSNTKLIGSVLGAVVLIAGGVFFIMNWENWTTGGSDEFFLSLRVTIFYSLFTVPFQLAISLGLAYLLFQKIAAKGMFRIIYFIPYIAPTVATAGIFRVIFSLREEGLANWAVDSIFQGAALKWLQESAGAVSAFGESLGIAGAESWTIGGPSLALFVIILFNIWVFVGYDTVIFLAGLGNIPNTLYEAGKIDGANGWQLFRHITVPLLSPTVYFLSVISVIGTFKAFNHIWVLRQPEAQGTVDTASVYFFSTFLRQTRFGYSTAMAMVLFVIILILFLIQQRMASRRVFYG